MTASTATNLIHLEAVSFAYSRDRDILRGVSITVRSGEIAVVTGPSGCGKSTLLGILAGDLEPHSGRRMAASSTARIAWIVQSSPILSHRTAIDNVALGALSRGLKSSAARDRAHSAMTLLGIDQLGQERGYRLSGGERQRVVVARAIASEATVVLADEPTSSLDGPNRDVVCDSLVAAAHQGVAVVVATHDQALIDRIPTRLRLDQENAAYALQGI